MKKLRYIIEGCFLHLLMFMFRLMPLDAASATGGWIGRTIGPRLAASRKARKNLNNALPDLTEERQTSIIKGMWDNLGRTMAEYPHLEKIARARVTYSDPHGAIPEMQQSPDKPYIYMAGHLANWEAAAVSILLQHNVPFNAIYREPNNPMARKLLDNARTLGGRFKTFPKSRNGMRQVVKSIKDGENVGILIDQKYNEGIAVDFFGMPAMTSPAFIELAQKFGAKILPGRVERLEGANFRITLYEALKIKDKSGQNRPVEDILKEAHLHLESWITERPEQWLWLHKRWPSAVLTKNNQGD